jgi:hypothetical protein
VCVIFVCVLEFQKQSFEIMQIVWASGSKFWVEWESFYLSCWAFFISFFSVWLHGVLKPLPPFSPLDPTLSSPPKKPTSQNQLFVSCKFKSC